MVRLSCSHNNSSLALGWDLFNRTVAWKKRNIASGVYGVEYIYRAFQSLSLTTLDPSLLRSLALESITRAEQAYNSTEEYLITMIGSYARLGQLWTGAILSSVDLMIPRAGQV